MLLNKTTFNVQNLIFVKITCFVIFCFSGYYLQQLNFKLKDLLFTQAKNGDFYLINLLIKTLNTSYNELIVFTKIGLLNCLIGAVFALLIPQNKSFLKTVVIISATLMLVLILTTVSY